MRPEQLRRACRTFSAEQNRTIFRSRRPYIVWSIGINARWMQCVPPTAASLRSLPILPELSMRALTGGRAQIELEMTNGGVPVASAAQPWDGMPVDVPQAFQVTSHAPVPVPRYVLHPDAKPSTSPCGFQEC